MRALILRWLLIAFTVHGAPVQADELTLTYDGFYDRMKTVTKDEYSMVTMRFLLVTLPEREPCPITSGTIYSKTEEQAVVVDSQQSEFFLPFDKKLDSDKAVVVFDVPGRTQCTLTIHVVSDVPLSKNIEYKTLASVWQQFDDMLDDLAGFMFSWSLPDIKGLIVEFEKGSSAIDPALNGVTCKENQCFVDMNMLKETSISFEQTPMHLRPWMDKDER